MKRVPSIQARVERIRPSSGMQGGLATRSQAVTEWKTSGGSQSTTEGSLGAQVSEEQIHIGVHGLLNGSAWASGLHPRALHVDGTGNARRSV